MKSKRKTTVTPSVWGYIVPIALCSFGAAAAVAQDAMQRDLTHRPPVQEAATRLAKEIETAAPLSDDGESKQAREDAWPELAPPAWQEWPDDKSAMRWDRVWIAKRAAAFAIIFVSLVVGQRLFQARRPNGHAAIELCGKVRMDARQSLHLVRVGQRLLVLHESAQGVQRLAEITDPDEVERLLGPGANRDVARRPIQRGAPIDSNFPHAYDLEAIAD